jgi:hypothetical protein
MLIPTVASIDACYATFAYVVLLIVIIPVQNVSWNPMDIEKTRKKFLIRGVKYGAYP